MAEQIENGETGELMKVGKLVADTVFLPGTSLYLNGRVGDGVVHTVGGGLLRFGLPMAGAALFGPVTAAVCGVLGAAACFGVGLHSYYDSTQKKKSGPEPAQQQGAAGGTEGQAQTG